MDNDIAELIIDLKDRGVTLWAEDGEVRMKGALSSCRAQIERLRDHKPAVLTMLQSQEWRLGGPEEGIIRPGCAAEFEWIQPARFSEMLDLQRYERRSPAFNKMISATELHFWDPRDQRYLDLEAAFDVKREPMIAEAAFACLRAPIVRARLSEPSDRVGFINKIVWLRFSTLLHGEQGALNLAASLCGQLKDAGAQEFAANQTREEARHVTAFSLYIKARWGRPAPCMPSLANFLSEIIASHDVTKKIIGMQVMVEGLAMGSLGSLHRNLIDPAGRRLTQLVMTDEAFHHKFGKLWAETIMPKISSPERAALERWTTHCLDEFIVKMDPPVELQILRRDYGLDPMIVAREIKGLELNDGDSPLGAHETFRVLASVLLNAGLLSADAQVRFKAFLKANLQQKEHLGYEDIVEEGLSYLRHANGAREGLA